MYKQNCSTLKTLQKLPNKAKSTILANCDSEFIRFMVECVVNLIDGNLEGLTKQSLKRHEPILKQIYNRKHKSFRSDQRKLLKSPKGLALINYISPAIISKFC